MHKIWSILVRIKFFFNFSISLSFYLLSIIVRSSPLPGTKKFKTDRYRSRDGRGLKDDCYNMLTSTNYELFEFEYASQITVAFFASDDS